MKTKRIILAITAKEHKKFKQMAEKSGVSMSELIRRMIKDACN